ncbi:DUF1660 family phage protein [Lactococcus lactis]|uniref:DUF1660 family phage protein n=1 Tax=Lactococcus lactis TaxID=1358 RepID=UPI003F851C2D
MKLMCKLFGHKWIYYDLHKRCKWCDERVWFSKATLDLFKANQQLKQAFARIGTSLNDVFKNKINRSDLDESEKNSE